MKKIIEVSDEDVLAFQAAAKKLRTKVNSLIAQFIVAGAGAIRKANTVVTVEIGEKTAVAVTFEPPASKKSAPVV